MPVKIQCPGCGRQLQVKERALGKTIRCPACENSFVAPTDTASLAGNGHKTAVPLEPVTQARQSSSTPGQIGRFRITAALGQGGFGTVYKAHDPILNREVALKIPRHDSQGAERLIQEAQAAAPLRHPHIVAVYEAGADGDELFIATEYVEGKTLADHSQHASVDAPTAAQWVKSLAEALDYAHHEGVIHRDVKPHNIMIGASAGRAQLMDFGLARSGASRDEAAEHVIGTPAYMSPEQARGDTANVGPASDQYSLGCVLYELLTGERPFDGGSESISQIAAGQTPRKPRAINKGIHRDLEAICIKAMSPEAQRRYSSCGALAEDLGRWLNDELVRARRYMPWELAAYWARKRPAAFGWTAAAVCLISLLLAGGASYGVRLLFADDTRSNGPTTVNTRLTSSRSAGSNSDSQADSLGAHTDMTFYGRLLDRTRMSLWQGDVSRADHWLEQSRWDYRNWEYRYLRRITTGGWRTIYGHQDEISAIAIHPAGERFASASLDGTVRVWRIATGEQLRLLQCSQTVTSLAYSPDGNLLAIATGVAGGQPSMAMGAPGMAPVPAAHVPSPAENAGGQTAPPTIQYVVSLRDAESLDEVGEFRKHTGAIQSLAFSPDGTAIVSGGLALQTVQGNGGPQMAASEVFVWNVDSQTVEKQLANPMGAVRRVAFSPDGQRVVATVGRGAFGQILIWNLQTSAAPPNPASGPEEPTSVVEQSGNGQSDVLPPERQLAGSPSALVVSPANGGEIIAAPFVDLWLLEQGRRRVSGDLGTISRWPLGVEAPEDRLSGDWLAVNDLALSGDASSMGSFALAMAGGDPLLRSMAGSITLRDPAYSPGTSVKYLGHTATATAVAFRPDGKQFISGSANGIIKIWNAEVHPEVVKLGPTRSATRVAFGRDGRYVAVADRNEPWSNPTGMMMAPAAPGAPAGPAEVARGEVKLFDIRTGKELTRFTSGPGDVLGLALDPEMKWIAAGGEDASVHVWDLESGSLRFEEQFAQAVRCLAASADGKYLAAACGTSQTSDPGQNTAENSGEIVVFNTADGTQIARWNAHPGPVLSVAFSPDAKLLVSSGTDRRVILWNIADQKPLRSLSAFDGEIINLSFRPNGEDIAGAGYDPCRPDQAGDVLVWDAETGKRRLRLSGTGLVYDVAYSPDGQRLVSGGGAYEGSRGRPGELKVWDAETGTELLPLVGRTGRNRKRESYAMTYKVTVNVPVMKEVPRIVTHQVEKVGPDGQPITEDVSETIMVQVCEMQTREETRSKIVSSDVQWEEPGTILGVAFSGDGRCIAAACEDGSALVWDAESCQPHHSAKWPNGVMICGATSADGKWIATAGDSGNHCECRGLIRIYDAVTGRLAREIQTASGPVLDVAFTNDSRRLVTVAGCGQWFPSAPKIGSDVAPLRPEVYQNFFARQQTVDKSGKAEVWELATGKRTSEIAGHKEALTCLAVDPASDRALIGSADGNVRLVDLSSGKQVSQWTELSPVVALAFSADGKQFASASIDGKLWLGDLQKTQSPPKLLSENVSGVVDMAFHPGTNQLAAVTRQIAANSPMVVSGPALEPEFTSPKREQGKLFVWNLESLAKPSIYTLPVSANNAVFDATGRWLAVAGADASVHIVDAGSGRTQLALQGHRAPAKVMALSDGRIVSVSSDRLLKSWDIATALQNIDQCTSCTPPRERTVELATGSQQYIHKLRFSRQANLAAVGGHVMNRMESPSVQHPVRVVDAQSGESRHSGGHYDVVRSVATRPGSTEFASVGQDQNLYVWNDQGGAKPAAQLPNKVMKVVYSRDGKMIATCTAFDGQVYLLDADSLEERKRFQAEPMTVFALVFATDGKQLITGGLSGALKVWDTENGTLVREWPAHEGTIQSVALSKDGQLLASCGHDQKVKLWKFENGEAIRTIEGFAGPAWDCAFSPDDALLAVGAHDPVARIFQVETGELATELGEHGQGVWSIAFSPDGSKLACCGRESPLIVWDWQQKSKITTNPQAGECLAWLPDGSKLITGSVLNTGPPPQPEYDGVITLHDPKTGKAIDQITIPDAPRPAFDVSPDGRYVVVGRKDGATVVWDRSQKKIVAECRQPAPIHAVAFHPDAALNTFAVASQDKSVRIWSTDGSELGALAHDHPVLSLAYDPQGRVLATGDGQQNVYLWNVNERKQTRVLGENDGEIRALSFSGDGNALAVVTRRGHENGWIGTLNVWDVKSGQRTLSTPSHTWWEADVAFHPRLPQIATTGQGHTFQLLDAKTGQTLLSIPTNGHLCDAMVFTPDGRLLVQLAGRAKLIDATPEPQPFSRITEPAQKGVAPSPAQPAPVPTGSPQA